MATTKSLLFVAALLSCVVIIHSQRADTDDYPPGFDHYPGFCADYFLRNCVGIYGAGNSISSAGVYTTNCWRGGEYPAASSIDLNSHISNQDGRLVLGGGFASTCYGYIVMIDQYMETWLFASGCQRADKSYTDLSYFPIGNYLVSDRSSGTLSWESCAAV